MWRFTLLLLFCGLLFNLPLLSVQAASCPVHSKQVSQVIEGNQRITTCQCLSGYTAQGNRCVQNSITPQSSSIIAPASTRRTGVNGQCGSGLACKQLRSVVKSGQMAVNALSIEAMKYDASLGWDTTGVPVDNGQVINLNASAYHSLPAATRNDPQFRRLVSEEVLLQARQVKVNQQVLEARQALVAAATPKQGADLQVKLLRLLGRSTRLHHQEYLVRYQSLVHFKVDVRDVLKTSAVSNATSKQPSGSQESRL